MTNNYFAIERSGQCIDHAIIKKDDGTIAFQDIMEMSYNEIKSYKDVDVLVTSIMDAVNEYFDSVDEQTIITLVAPDDVFIWSIIIGLGDTADTLNYGFVDWQKDGKSYRYKKN